MRNNRFAAALIGAAFIMPLPALAQSPVEDGARAGGAIGGIVGGTVGAAVQLPADVLRAVTGAPGRSVVVEERIVIGEPLPPRVAIVTVPNHRQYSYAIVNDRRVIVDPGTRRVVHIID